MSDMRIRAILEDMIAEFLRGKGASFVIGEATRDLDMLMEAREEQAAHKATMEPYAKPKRGKK